MGEKRFTKPTPGAELDSETTSLGAMSLMLKTVPLRFILALLSLLLMAAPLAHAQRLERIYFVPLDQVAEPDIEQLAAFYRDTYGIPVEILPQLEVSVSEVDVPRRQVIAEELIRLMRTTYRDIAADGGAQMIGITRHHMYIRGMPQWQWAFSLREDGRYAMLSTFAMDPRNYREPADPELLATRLRKMVTKSIGLQYFGLPANSDPTSVMYNGILGIDDLDRVGEDLPLG